MQLNATILGQTISFILFVLFCMKYVWPPIINVIEKRQKKISDGLIFFERTKKDLEKTKIIIEKKILEAERNAKKIIENANKKSIKILENIKKEAIIEKNKIIKEAYLEIDIKIKKSYDEMRKKISNLIIQGAEKIIQSSLSESNHSIIIKKILSKL